MEQPIFCVGDKVVCVDSSGKGTYLTEGKKYTITHVKRCEGCGIIGVAVGIKYKKEVWTTSCATCKTVSVPLGQYIYQQKRFAPIDAIENIEAQVFEALKGAKILDKL